MSSNSDIDPRLRGPPVSTTSQQPANSQSNYRQATPIAPHPNPASTAPSSSSSGAPLQQHQGVYHNGNGIGNEISQSQHQHPHPYLQPQPQNTFHTQSPATPGSTDNAADPYAAGTSSVVRRARACEACRGLKVKCEPDIHNEDGPCSRCARANRNCVVTQPSRKRQKKTDTRVAELEKKLEDMQASVMGRRFMAAETDVGQQPLGHTPASYHQASNGPYGQDQRHPVRSTSTGNDWHPFAKTLDVEGKVKSAPMVVAAGKLKRKLVESPDASTPEAPLNFKGAAASKNLFDQVHSVWSDNPDVKPQTHIYSDIIDRGELTAEVAAQIFDFYVTDMAPHLPAVVFTPGTNASSVRKEKPILFLAILAVGAGPTYPDVQASLTKEVMSVYADRIIMKGEKSLEIIQALQVTTLWYYPPEHFEELKFYQLVHIAAIMAIDIGMGKSSKSSSNRTAGLFRDTPWRKQPYPDSDSVEARRAWLACYFLCCNTAMGLRRPNLIRWTPYMAECVQVLETSPQAFPSDQALCAWVRSQHIAEEVGYEFSMDDPSAKISISDDKVNYALKKFEQDLERWRMEVPVGARSDSLKMTGHVVELYMHEIAMHVDHNVDEFKPPYNEETIQGLVNPPKPDELTTTHVRALSLCLTSIDSVFEVFLKHSVDVVRCLPVANFVRVAYATVVLIKMALAASHTDSGIGKIFVSSKLRVEEHLDGLIALFNKASAGNKSRPSSKFLMVLVMLKTWFTRRQQGFKNAKEESLPNVSMPASSEQAGSGQIGDLQRTNGQQQQNQVFAPNGTPLQVLSEVATGNSREQTRTDNQYAPTNDWQQASMQQQFQPYPNMDPALQQGFAGAGNMNDNYGMTSLNYTMGDDFESQMGFTLAGLDAYLGEDAFFSGVMNGGYEADGF